jgi:hypothetical protein
VNPLMRRVLPAVLVAVVALLSSVAPAQASTRSKIIADCSDDGVLQGHYTPSQIRDARKHLPTDVAEYTDCEDVLRRAELPSGGSTTNTGTTPTVPGAVPPSTPGGGAPAPAPVVPETDADRQALIEAHDAPEHPVQVGGENLLAGAAPLREGYRANGLPGSLVIALILLGLAGLALSIPPVRRRLPPLHRLVLRRS